MKDNFNNIFSILIIAIYLIAAKSNAENRNLRVDKVYSMLRSYSIEGCYDENYNTQLREIENAGEAAYPALEEILMTTDDDAIVGTIAGLFGSTKGDKSIPIRSLRNFIEQRGNRNPRFFNLHHVIHELSEIGGSEEFAFLQRYFNNLPDDGDKEFRHSLERSLRTMSERLVQSREMTSPKPLITPHREGKKPTGQIPADTARNKQSSITGKTGALFSIACALITIVLLLLARRYIHRNR